MCCVVVVQSFVTPWTGAHQAPLSMEFSRQEYWSGLPRPSPGDLPDLRLELESPALQVGSLPAQLSGKPLLMIHDHKEGLKVFISLIYY